MSTGRQVFTFNFETWSHVWNTLPAGISFLMLFFFFRKLKKNIWRLISVLDPDPYSQNVKRKFVLIVDIRNPNPSRVMFLTKPEEYNHLFEARLCLSSVKVIIQTLRYFQTLNKFQYFLERHISCFVWIQNLRPR